MSGKIKYNFSGKVWQYSAPSGWYFVSLPQNIAKEIRDMLKSEEEGWGRLKTVAQIGKSEWKTAVWYDSKKNTYILPLKADIRKKEIIEIDKNIEVALWF